MDLIDESLPDIDLGMDDESEEPSPEEIEKEKKRQHERDLLLGKLASGNMEHLTTRVALILNQYPETRNSDVTLQLKYWETFQNDIYSGSTLTAQDLYQLERLTSITRARAKIQNEYKLFHAQEEIRRFRRSREEYEREAQLATRTGIPSMTISCDESGKNDRFVMVGGVWVHDLHREAELRRRFITWRNSKEFRGEFHFTKMSRNELPLYKEFFDEVIRLSDMMSFVLVIADRTAIRGRATDDIIYDLHYQLVHKGIEHEVESGRIELPRQVNFWKDKDDGTDRLMMEKLQQYMVTQFRLYFEDRLTLSIFDAIESHFSIFVQIADVFVGSISRLLNQPNGSNHKDELAHYVANLLGVTVDGTNITAINDSVMIHQFYE